MTEVTVTLQTQPIDVTVTPNGESITVDIGAPLETPVQVTSGSIDASGLLAVPISPDEGNNLVQRENGIFGATYLKTKDW